MHKKQIITFMMIFIIAIISTIFFLKPHYSIDTLEFLNNGFDTYIHSKFLVDGRIFSVLLLKVVINMPMKYVIPLLYVIGILISCASVMYIRKLIIKYANSEEKWNIIPTIISYVLIFNFMYIDSFQFIEFPIIALSILLYIIVAKIITEKKKGYILKSFILTLIAMFCYQGTINVLIATTFVISIIQNRKLNKNVIIDIIKLGIILLVTVGINYGFTKIVGGTHRLDLNIIENCKYAIINLYLIIFTSGNHYPQYWQLILVLIMIVFCYIKKIKILNLLWIYIVSIGSNIILLIITSNGFMTTSTQYGRIFFSIGALVGYMYMYLWCTSDKIKKDNFIKALLGIYFATIVIIYFQYTYSYMQGQYIDKYIITNINRVISKYEEETGKKIEKYSYRIDYNNNLLETKNILGKEYNKRNYATVLCGRRTNEQISNKLFYLYADREIKYVFGPDEFKEQYFKDVNLNEIELFDQRRFVFEGDTVYIIF